MTLVALGLLLRMVGLVWVMVIDINQPDHQTKRESPRAQDNRSRRQYVSSSRQRTEFRYDKSDRTSFSMAAER
jgi:thiosulfate reductase cytochrome b subunit